MGQVCNLPCNQSHAPPHPPPTPATYLDVDGGTYFVTSCLSGSIPAQGLLDIKQYEHELAKRRPGNHPSNGQQIRDWKLVFARTDSWLDRQPAAYHLADPRLSDEVEKSMYHFAGTRYDLLAYVVMPSHFHWVFRPLESWTATLPSDDDSPSPREIVMHSLKRFTARTCNELLGTQGSFWQDESYDHSVRDEDELLRIIEYVEMNPVNAGLVAESHLWRHSSAHWRKMAWVDPGTPLLPRESNA